MTEKNEFEEMYNADEFNDSETEVLSEKTPEASDMVAGNESLEYDMTKAPTTAKGPDRVSLDGKEVIIEDAKLLLPKPESAWDLSRDKKNRLKGCQFILFYDKDGQREYYSGVKVFPRDVNGVEKYSEPSIQNSDTTQAGALKMVYAKYKGKKVSEVSLNEFFAFLKSKPKALIQYKPFEYDKKTTMKNIVVKFLG
jgi:hypothetical protein